MAKKSPPSMLVCSPNSSSWNNSQVDEPMSKVSHGANASFLEALRYTENKIVDGMRPNLERGPGCHVHAPGLSFFRQDLSLPDADLVNGYHSVSSGKKAQTASERPLNNDVHIKCIKDDLMSVTCKGEKTEKYFELKLESERLSEFDCNVLRKGKLYVRKYVALEISNKDEYYREIALQGVIGARPRANIQYVKLGRYIFKMNYYNYYVCGIVAVVKNSDNDDWPFVENGLLIKPPENGKIAYKDLIGGITHCDMFFSLLEKIIEGRFSDVEEASKLEYQLVLALGFSEAIRNFHVIIDNIALCKSRKFFQSLEYLKNFLHMFHPMVARGSNRGRRTGMKGITMVYLQRLGPYYEELIKLHDKDAPMRQRLSSIKEKASLLKVEDQNGNIYEGRRNTSSTDLYKKIVLECGSPVGVKDFDLSELQTISAPDLDFCGAMEGFMQEKSASEKKDLESNSAVKRDLKRSSKISDKTEKSTLNVNANEFNQKFFQTKQGTSQTIPVPPCHQIYTRPKRGVVSMEPDYTASAVQAATGQPLLAQSAQPYMYIQHQMMPPQPTGYQMGQRWYLLAQPAQPYMYIQHQMMPPQPTGYQMRQVMPMQAANPSGQRFMTPTPVQGFQPSSMHRSGMEQNNPGLQASQVYIQHPGGQHVQYYQPSRINCSCFNECPASSYNT